jgi:hypothetical protein
MSSRNRQRFGSGFERLEDRTVPAITEWWVNTTADTSMAGTIQDPVTGQTIPVDANAATSLRAVVTGMNMRPLTGADTYNVDLTLVAGQTITLNPNRATLEIDSNANFLIEGFSKNGTTVTVQRSGTNVVFRLFEVDSNNTVSFANMILQGGQAPTGGAIQVDDSAKV